MDLPPDHDQTFAALRARREARRAQDRLEHRPLDPYQFYCRNCGQPLDNRDLDGSDQVRCAACGEMTALPPRPANELRRRRLRRWGRRPRSPREDLVVFVYLLIALLLFFAIL